MQSLLILLIKTGKLSFWITTPKKEKLLPRKLGVISTLSMSGPGSNNSRHSLQPLRSMVELISVCVYHSERLPQNLSSFLSKEERCIY